MRSTSAIAVPVLVLSTLSAQPAPAPPEAPGGGPAGPAISSPEVHPDRRVTFRLFAPQASKVRLHFERGGENLRKGADGVWTVTAGPMEPGAYRYGFAVDGANLTDPRNIEVERMQVLTRSIVYVPGAEFMDERQVPHGSVSVVPYHSKTLGQPRRLHVYTPPGYEGSNRRYPVLLLLHGANESDQSWAVMGRAGFILDNLIAEGKAEPMIVVMPNGHADQVPPVIFSRPGGPTPLSRELSEIPAEIAGDILPLVDGRYRTVADRAHRAIAGLSMGGSQALNIGMSHLKLFSAVGVFSSGILGSTVEEWEAAHRKELGGTRDRAGLKTFWFRTGNDDFLLNTTKSTVEMLKRHGFAVQFEESAGAHSWVNWREYLREFAPLLFRYKQ